MLVSHMVVVISTASSGSRISCCLFISAHGQPHMAAMVLASVLVTSYSLRSKGCWMGADILNFAER